MLYIESTSELEKHAHLIKNRQILAVDVETTGFCPFQDKLRLVQVSNGEETLVIDAFKVGKEAISAHLKPVFEDKGVIKLLQNSKFDLKFLKRQLNCDVERVFDSFIASQLIEAGVKQEKGYHGLGELSNRYLGLPLNKEEQKSDWSGELSQSQLEYAAKDVEVLFPLREKLIEYLKKFGLIRCAKLEFEAVLPVAWLELCGFYLDFDQWLEKANAEQIKAEKLANSIYEDLAPFTPQTSLFGEPAINLGSHQQIQKYFSLFGVPMPSSTKEEFLTPLAKDFPILQKLIDYRGHDKAYTSFGENYREFVNPVTGRIHSNFFQIGAPTGRFASSNPNLSQIPGDPEYRQCFKAQGDNTLISADFSQEELRLLADYSKDTEFLKIFSQGGDFHKHTASILFGTPIENVSKQERDLAKRLNFGVVYGIGAKKFARTANIPQTEAALIINMYFNTFKGVKRYLDYKKQDVLVKRYGRTPSGRMARYEWDDTDFWQTSKVQREAANLVLQGGGADILKRSLRVFYDNSKPYHDRIKLVNIVHDQMDVESPKDIADDVQDILVKSMVSAGSEFVSQVEIKVDAGQSDYWKKD